MPEDKEKDKTTAWLSAMSSFDGSNPLKAIPWELVNDHTKAQMIQDREAISVSYTHLTLPTKA